MARWNTAFHTVEVADSPVRQVSPPPQRCDAAVVASAGLHFIAHAPLMMAVDANEEAGGDQAGGGLPATYCAGADHQGIRDVVGIAPKYYCRGRSPASN